MQLHSLTITAFGPFAETQYVDFDVLAAGGLFLFHGPTGAGKTSILDAVCFALYGQVPGARAGSRSLRSDHAGPGIRPEVVLETTLRGRRMRLTRSAQWDRPKQRGTGTTIEQPRVHLEERHGDAWTSLSHRLDETGQLVGRLLGLTMTQFCQVVLLPQGQFAEFLRADADRRRAVLESLFDTERFASVEGWLVERRKASFRVLEEADQQIARVAARAAEAAGAEPPDRLDGDATASWVTELLSAARGSLEAATGDVQVSERSRTAAASTLDAATRVRDLQVRRERLIARQQSLLQRQAERDAAATELVAARTVAPILPLLAEVGRLQSELELARAEALSAHGEVAGFLAATGTSSSRRAAVVGTMATGGRLPPPGVVAQSAAAARAEVISLQRLTDHEVEADQLVRDIDALERAIVADEAEVAQVTAWLDAAPDTRGALVEAREASRSATAELALLREAQRSAAAHLGAAERRDTIAATIVAAADELRRDTDLAQRAREIWLTLRQARLDGMAAELAAGLATGDSCPVCGSTDHPALATTASDAVTREQEGDASRLAASTEKTRSLALERRNALDVTLAEARSAAGGDTPVDLLRVAEHDAALRLAAAAATAATLGATEAAVHDFDQEREQRVRQQVRLAQQRQEAGARAVDQRARLTRLHSLLAKARGDDASIASRAERLLALADDCDRLAAQIADTERLETAVGAALDRAESAATERELGSLDAVAAAARDDARVIELDEFRQVHDAELATVAELLADPELIGVDRQATPDLSVLAAQAEAADALHAQAIGAHSGARSRVDALERLRSGLGDLLSARAPLAAQHRTVDGLSRLAEGKSPDNRLRMSLSGYVLAARLEQVAAAASQRLERMSSGRYRLVHTAEGAGGRGRGGLGLRVLDAWTGADRDPATLSGGESFSASLALALGLADVVSQEAGGSLLETLFVDEGFGTLDDDTLDEVMGVLDDLREGGRVVGLVSHVADLRQRIPVQLRVEKGRTGSTVRQ